MFDMIKLMGRMKEVQEKMKEVQESLALITIEGESAAGMVKATVNGKKQLLTLDIDDALVQTADKQVMQDLIVAAVNDALTKSDEKIKEYMQKATENFLPPGMNLSNLGGLFS